MNTDDGQRMNMQNHGMRKPMAQKYPEKNPNYSPSTSYNYSPQTGYNGNSQMFQRRRPGQQGQDRFRSNPSSNSNERVLRQNDIIIRLLKEIRDRLPMPGSGATSEAEAVVDASVETSAAAEGWDGEDQEQPNDPIAEKKDEQTPDADESGEMIGNSNDQ